MSRRLLLGALLTLLLPLSACSSGGPDGKADDADSAASPAGPPPGFTTRSLGPVNYVTPQDWLPVPPTATAGIEQLNLRAPAPEGVSASVALALLQAQPRRAAAAEADSAVRIKRDVQRAQNVRSETLTPPGFTLAIMVFYDEPGTTGDLVRTEQLVGDLTGGGLFVLTVKGSQDSFEAQQLPAIVRSVTAES